MNEQEGASNFKNFSKVLTLIHFAIVGGLIVSFIFLTNLASGDELPPLSFTQQPIEFILPVALIGAIALGRFLSKNILSKLKPEDRLQKKLATYQTTHLIKIALLEGVAFFSIFSSDKTNSFNLVIAVLALVILLTLIPTKEKIESSIPIHAEDQLYLRNPETPFK